MTRYFIYGRRKEVFPTESAAGLFIARDNTGNNVCRQTPYPSLTTANRCEAIAYFSGSLKYIYL